MSLLLSFFPFVRDGRIFSNAKEAVAYIQEIYVCSTRKIESAFDRLVNSSELDQTPALDACYPFVGLVITNHNLYHDLSVSYGVIHEPGVYGTTVTRPDLFESYYIEQLSLLMERHRVEVVVAISDAVIPLPYVVEKTEGQLDSDQLWRVKNGFVLPNLSRINDHIPNGTFSVKEIRPLAPFSAERVDYSLHRLYHYTGTSADHFQGFILLTNYQRYIDAFVAYSLKEIESDETYTELVGPGNITLQSLSEPPLKPTHLPQMPAYHLKRKDNQGITLINIGIGPSNAKNITDHLAVLRPHCWFMVGHCAGLRSTQLLGDYVLAHGYVREDHVLDQDLPLWIPVPPIAEVQVALQEAITHLSHGDPLKKRVRTGTVVTTDNRNWELRSQELYERFRQSRAIALDMESATIAANGFRFRVPYGTLLCVSDKPIHGEIKLQGMANNFYRERVHQHLLVCLEAARILRESGVDQLHSRKLRGFDEPPFR